MNNFFGNSPRHKIKPIFLGDERVGKTSIIAKYTNSEYKNDTKIDFYTKNIELLEEKVNLMIFDIKGHHSFEKIIIPYIKDVNAFIIIFDLTYLSSFYNVGEWINKIKKYNKIISNEYYPILLIGNKRDLEKERVIKYEEAEKFAIYNKLLYIEMSKNDDIIRLNMTLETYFYKILTLNNRHDEPSSCNINYINYINYSNVFDDKDEHKLKKSNNSKLVSSKSLDNIELLDDKYKGNKYYYECKKTISQCNIL
jgi:small GTP-binding protein